MSETERGCLCADDEAVPRGEELVRKFETSGLRRRALCAGRGLSARCWIITGGSMVREQRQVRRACRLVLEDAETHT